MLNPFHSDYFTKRKAFVILERLKKSSRYTPQINFFVRNVVTIQDILIHQVQPVPQPVQELESESESQHDTDAWSTRQSTMEERVIDRYVIDTHPTPMYDPNSKEMNVEHQLPTTDEEEEEEEPVEEQQVVVSSAPGSRHQDEETEEDVSTPVEPMVSSIPEPQHQHHQQHEETEEEVLISSSWNAPDHATRRENEDLESEFTAALEAEENVNTFSPELLSRSLEQQRNGIALHIYLN